jgi:Na+/melibiose symporter-like transporter
METRAQGATTGTMFLYGFGSISVGIKNNLLGYFLLIYYNQVLGLDAVLAASAMAIALLVDAVSDPWVGIWSDRVRTRWGRRHPFMYAAIVPFALAYYFILLDPGDISEGSLYLRLIFWLIVLRLSMTFYEVPRGALAPELSKDYDQRSQLAGWGMAFGWLGGAGIAFIAQQFFLESFVDRNGYQLLAFWGGLGIFIGATVSTVGLHSHIPRLHVPPPRPSDLKTLFSEAIETLSNRSWMVLFASGCIYSLLVGTEQGMGTYYNEYFWQWKPADISIFALFQAGCVIFLSFMAPFVARGRDKKKVAVAIFMTTIALGQLPLILRLIDPYVPFATLPANGTTALWWILLLHAGFLASVGSLGFIFIGSMAMEIVEDVQRKTNRREEGLLGTVNSFVQKLVGAGGVLISGIIISAVGFDAPGVTLEQLQGPVITRFAIVHICLGVTLPVVSTLLVLLYDIDRKGHEKNISELGYVEKTERSE